MFSANWFKGNEKNWIKWLWEFKDKPGIKFLEIGCFEGRATLWLLDNILTGDFCGISVIDTFEGGMEDGTGGIFLSRDVLKNFQENTKGYEDLINIYIGRSQDVLRGPDFQISKFVFVYIDGSHRSTEVLEDTILSWRLLKKGGILIFDDYGLNRYKNELENPKPAIDAFLSIFFGKYEVISKGYQVCLRKL